MSHVRCDINFNFDWFASLGRTSKLVRMLSLLKQTSSSFPRPRAWSERDSLAWSLTGSHWSWDVCTRTLLTRWQYFYTRQQINNSKYTAFLTNSKWTIDSGVPHWPPSRGSRWGHRHCLWLQWRGLSDGPHGGETGHWSLLDQSGVWKPALEPSAPLQSGGESRLWCGQN